MGTSVFEGAEKMLDLNQAKTPRRSDCSAWDRTRTWGDCSVGRENPAVGKKMPKSKEWKVTNSGEPA